MEKMKQLYAFHLNSLFIMIQGLFIDKILFDWTLETPTYTSTKFAINEIAQNCQNNPLWGGGRGGSPSI